MEWITEAKELYQEKKYNYCLELLYKNSEVAKKYVWSLIIVSFLLSGISFLLNYLIYVNILNYNFMISIVCVVAIVVAVCVVNVVTDAVEVVVVIAIVISMVAFGTVMVGMVVFGAVSGVTFGIVLVAFGVFAFGAVAVGEKLLLPFMSKKIIENEEKDEYDMF